MSERFSESMGGENVIGDFLRLSAEKRRGTRSGMRQRFRQSGWMDIAASILLVGGALLLRGDAGTMLIVAGFIVGLTGLGGWFAGIREQ